MEYEEAVKLKEAKIRDPKSHSFVQSYFIQTSYEERKLFYWNYKKEVGKVTIPTGLCKTCNNLKIQHND